MPTNGLRHLPVPCAVNDLIDDELEKLAAKDDGYHGHYHLTDKGELMKQSKKEAEMAKAIREHDVDKASPPRSL